jgi:hypothetical protein
MKQVPAGEDVGAERDGAEDIIYAVPQLDVDGAVEACAYGVAQNEHERERGGAGTSASMARAVVAQSPNGVL